MPRLALACLVLCVALAFVARGGMVACAIAAAAPATSQPCTAPAASCCEEVARSDKHAPAKHAPAEMSCCFVAATIDPTPARTRFETPRVWPAVGEARAAGRTLEPRTPPPRDA